MIIKEAILNNFGRFQNQRISFQEGINVVYGANDAARLPFTPFFGEFSLACPEKEALLPKQTPIPASGPGRTLPGMKEPWFSSAEEKVFVWKEIFPNLVHRLPCTARQTGSSFL